MPRKYRKRKKFFNLKLKAQTIYTSFFIIFVCLSALITISFFQSGTVLDFFKNITIEYFGWLAVILPLVLLSLSTFFIKIKSPFTNPNVPFGMLLSFLTLAALTRNGYIGDTIWYYVAFYISWIGAFILFSAIFFIGLMILFNTSIEEIVKSFTPFFKSFQKYLSEINSKRKKSVFQEKLPIKAPSFTKDFIKETPSQKDNIGNKVNTKIPIGLDASPVITNIQAATKIWEYPPLSLLSSNPGQEADRGNIKNNADIIEKTLESFGIQAKVAEINKGPAVTQYCLEIALGIKVSKITALQNDLALALSAPTGTVRIEAPIPGRNLVGIEIPNRSLKFVTLRQMLESNDMKRSKDKLIVSLGLDVSGMPKVANIAKMPHVLIAGTTGSGKSVLINSWIASILFRSSPAEVKLIMVDPKRVELTGYNGIPHLLTEVIVEPDKILSALRWSISEMEKRYKLFAEIGVKNIEGHNELSGIQPLPYIVIFIDELADLMAYAPVDVEDSICRLAQMARATGIHLVLSTQRPSTDVITGLIKANVPSRIAFNVSSMVDSRVIIDTPGAEKLLGRGDMLYIPPDQAKPTRIQGTFVSDNEIQKLVEFLKTNNQPAEYASEITSQSVSVKKGIGTVSGNEDGKDPLFADAVRVICQYDKASASLLQRKLKIGYSRAARVIDQLEEEGIIGAGEGAKPRDVLIKNPEQYFLQQEAQQSEEKIY
jgi:S-DNA-T family DNA segregation ATPase FtsK/SpoIIIE